MERIISTKSVIVFLTSVSGILSSYNPAVMEFYQSDLNRAYFNCSSSCGDTSCSDTSGDLYFRYLAPSKTGEFLYVGAMNYLFKLNKTTLECVGSRNLKPDRSQQNLCEMQLSDVVPPCQNHIRVIMEKDDRLSVCGTGAYRPIYYEFSTDLKQNFSSDRGGTAMCPYDPQDNSTAILVEKGNPGGAAVGYYGTYADFMKNFPVFYRFKYTVNGTTYLDKNTDKELIQWLYYPQFVGSFDVDTEVFVFFRETAMENSEEKNRIYSRVAKVCKNDLRDRLDQTKKWLSFQKSRLNCSLPGQTYYFFDDLYDVYRSGDYFFALFFKQGGAELQSSAICVYTLEAIHQAFDGPFKYKDGSSWVTTPDRGIRPDNCTERELDLELYKNFKKTQYLFMERNVEALFSEPIFYEPGVQLMRLAVTESKSGARNIYAASSEGDIYDLFFKMHNDQYTVMKTAVYKPFVEKGQRNMTSVPIWNIKLEGSELYMGTDVEVTKINVSRCSQISKIDTCILNTWCVWNNNTRTCKNQDQKGTDNSVIVSHENITNLELPLYQTLTSLNSIPSSPLQRNVKAISGLYVSLELDCILSTDGRQVVWTHDNKIITDGDKFVKTSDGDLVIKNITVNDKGHYLASLDKYELLSVSIDVSESIENITEVWKQQFVEWSSAFQKWKSCANDYISTCRKPSN